MSALEIGKRIAALGFSVYMAGSNEYGVFTNADGSIVVAFNERNLSGNYGPPSRISGTGWRMATQAWDLRTKEDVEAALKEASNPPKWCGNGFRYLTNITQYLETYGASSKYKRLEAAA